MKTCLNHGDLSLAQVAKVCNHLDFLLAKVAKICNHLDLSLAKVEKMCQSSRFIASKNRKNVLRFAKSFAKNLILRFRARILILYLAISL